MKSMKPDSGKRYALYIGILLAILLQACILLGPGGSSDLPPTVYRGYFQITSPAAGARLNMDSTCQIQWTPSDSVSGSNVRIAVYQGDKLIVTLTTLAANTGGYSWLPSSSISSSGYKLGSGMTLRIKITSTQDTSKYDFGPYFTMYSKYSGGLSIKTPTTGSQAKIDSALAIRWTTNGSIGSYAGIQLYKDTALVSTITTFAPTTGYYLWPMVSTSLGSGNDYHIRVFSINDPSISSLSPAFSITSSYTGGFTVTYPQAGDSIVAGGTSKVTWSTTGNPGSEVVVTLVRDSASPTSISYGTLTSYDSVSWYPSLGMATSSRYRIKIASLSDASIYAYSSYFTVKGSDPDSFEVDDSLKLAKAIPVTGETQQHTMTYGDQDWLRFTTKLGKRYMISVRSSAVSVYAYVYDSAGVSTSTYQSGTNFQMILMPTYAGKYHVRVTSSSGYGAYTIGVTEYDSTQSTFAVNFTSPDDKTTWAAGSTYTINYSPDSLFYGSTVSLSLYNDSGFVQSITTYASNTGAYSWSLPSGLFTSSKYRIRIASYSNSQIYAYSPYFTISGVTPDAYESDNAKTTAKTLAADGVAQSRNLTSGDVDWIKINVVSGKHYLASINSPIYSVYAYLLDSNSFQVNYQSGTLFSLPITPTYTGAYYIRMNPSSGYGNYSISLISYDSTQGGFPAKFTAPDSATTWASGSSYTINYAADQTIYGTTISLALYLDSGLVSSISTGLSNTGSYSWSVPSGLVTSSRYRIRVSSYNNSQVYGYSPAFTISGLTPDAYEPDNSRLSAKSITTDGAAQQRNLTTNDSDWVKFSAVAGKTYLLSVSSATSVYMYVTDSTGYSLNSNSGTKFSLVLNPTRGGTYYVRVQYYYGTGPYALSVLAYDGGPGGVPTKFSAPIDSTTWAAGSSYMATWTPDTVLFGNYVNLGLYQDTTLIYSLASSVSNLTGSYSVSIPTGLASGNRYRIRMTNYSNYQIYGYSPFFSISGMAPDALEPNDSAAAAHAVATNAGKQQLSLTYHDHDWFKFTAKSNMLYIIQATSSSSLSTTMKLYSGLGASPLITNYKTSSLDSVNSIAWVAPSDGIYSVSVDPYSTSYYGAYGFEIKEVDPASYKFGVTAPAAAATAHLGAALNIVWTDPSSVKGYVDIFLYDGTGVVQTIAANVTNSGSYSWSVPSTLPSKSDYYVKIISRMSASISGSSGAFSIAP